MTARAFRLAAAVMAAAGLSACAALTVDVDVYKGPLANEEAVQTQQLAVLAVAAKPLLVQLRDEEETAKNPGFKAAAQKNGTPYAATYMDYDEKWKSVLAAKVNAILYLYEDRKSALTPFVVAVEAETTRIAEAGQILAGDATTWNRLAAAMKPDADGPLKDAYHQLLAPSGMIDVFRRSEILADAKALPDRSANALFKKLSDPEFVREKAKQLFPKDTKDSSEAFVAAVTGFARAFRDARGAIRDLWLLSVRELASLDNPGNGMSPDEAAKLKSTLPDFIAILSQPKYIAYVMCTTNGRFAAFQDGPAVNSPDPLRQPHAWAKADYDLADAALAAALAEHPGANSRTLLEMDELFRSSPFSPKPPCDAILDEGGHPAMRVTGPMTTEFGLARGPTLQRADMATMVTSIEDKAAKLSIAQGLDRGRLDDGIYTLIERYLTASFAAAGKAPDTPAKQENSTHDPKALATRNQLLDSLVQFAEKVTVLADNNVLLQDELESGATVKQVPDQSAIVGGRVASTRPKGTSKTYATLLQTVGNSIIVQANELRASEKHLAALKNRASAEREALARAQGFDAYAVLGDLQRQLRADKAKAAAAKQPTDDLDTALKTIAANTDDVVKTTEDQHAASDPPAVYTILRAALQKQVDAKANTAKDAQAALTAIKDKVPPLNLGGSTGQDAKAVLDDVIAALRYEYVQVLREQGKDSDRAKNIEAALAAAYNQRAGFAYLRPASAYLRSSYAATNLQDDPRLGWQNLLLAEVRKSLPIFGEALAPENQDLKVRSAIDKQFWQNINSIRLNGSGFTNYALVKDDIGNWYVKGFASDTTAITKAATNAALFNVNLPGLSAKLAQSIRGQAANPNNNIPSDANAPSPAFETVYGKYNDAYTKQTTDDFNAIFGTDGKAIDFTDKIQKAITDDWQAAVTTPSNDADMKLKDMDMSAAANAAMNAVSNAANADNLRSALQGLYQQNLDAFGQGNRVTQALQRTAKLGDALTKALSDNQANIIAKQADGTTLKVTDTQAQAAIAATAAKRAKSVVLKQIDALRQRRADAVKAYSQAVIFIGDAAYPPVSTATPTNARK